MNPYNEIGFNEMGIPNRISVQTKITENSENKEKFVATHKLPNDLGILKKIHSHNEIVLNRIQGI